MDPPTDSLHRNNGGTVRNDVELKVTDICSTNPQDPTYCATPADIKIDRIKADLTFSSVTNKTAAENAALQGGTEYPEKVWWFFSKCWDDVCTPSPKFSLGLVLPVGGIAC